MPSRFSRRAPAPTPPTSRPPARSSTSAAQCEKEKGGILINAIITINAVRVAPQVSRAEYVYFVAVVDSTRNILNEQRFTLDAQFTNQDFRQYVEKISVHLPLQHVSAGDGYAIIVGFQLTPEQLEFNRAHKRQS